MGAKISLVPGTGETDPQGFCRVTLGSTRASAAGIGCQLIVRRRRHAARGSGQAPVHTLSRGAELCTPQPAGGHSECGHMSNPEELSITTFQKKRDLKGSKFGFPSKNILKQYGNLPASIPAPAVPH